MRRTAFLALARPGWPRWRFSISGCYQRLADLIFADMVARKRGCAGGATFCRATFSCCSCGVAHRVSLAAPAHEKANNLYIFPIGNGAYYGACHIGTGRTATRIGCRHYVRASVRDMVSINGGVSI